MGNLTNDNDQLMINVFTDLKSNEYPINNTMVNLDISFSTIAQKDLLSLSGNDKLNENTLIFSCFDYKNTIGNFNKELTGYPYRQNNLFFINNEEYIFPLNYNILNKESHFTLNDNKITVNIDNSIFINNEDNVLVPNLNKIKKATGSTNGLFMINPESLYIDENNDLNIIYDYQYIINNFNNIYTSVNQLINGSEGLRGIKQKINYLLKLNYNESKNVQNKEIYVDESKDIIYEDNKYKIELDNFNKWNDWYYENWDAVIQNKDKNSGLFFPQIVESIDIDNDVFFDTGIIPDNTYGIYYKFSRNQVDIPNNISPDENNFKAALFIGCRNNSNDFKGMYIYSQEYKNNQSSSGNGYFIFWNKNSDKINGNLDKDIVHEIKLNFKNNKKVTFDNSDENDLNSGIFETGYSIYIGTINNNGSPHPHRESHKFYGAQITKEDKVIAEYYPAMQGSTKCIYDKINKRIIYPFGDLRNKNKRNYYHYFPQYFIDKDITDFNIIVPFKFKYTVNYGVPNYISYIDDIINKITVYKVNDKSSDNIITEVINGNTVEYTYNEYFYDVNYYNYLKNGNNIYDIFQETKYDIYDRSDNVVINNQILKFNKDKSYVIDYKITNDELYNNDLENHAINYLGDFKLVLNFSVNHKSNFDLCKIIIEFLLNDQEVEIINEDLPITLRFTNRKNNKINVNDTLFYNESEGFNFIGHGKAIGKCCIPEYFLYEKNPNYVQFYKKPVFISLNKYKLEYDKDNIPFRKYNMTSLICDDYSSLLTYDENINMLAFICYYNNKLLTNRYLDSFNPPNMNKTLHYVKNLYSQSDNNNNKIMVENIDNIYDYELNKIKENNISLGEDIYLKQIQNSQQFIFNNYINNKRFLNRSQNNKTNNELAFPQIFEICKNGLNKGDYYLPNVFEKYIIKNINKLNNNYLLLTSSYILEDNKYKIIEDSNKTYKIIKESTEDAEFRELETNVIFKVPDYSILSSDNYYMYFDKENNYYILDYLGNYEGTGYLSFNIKKNYSYNEIKRLVVKNVDFSNVNSEIKIQNNKYYIKCYLSEFFVCYEDSDRDMNIINNEYRILFKVFIKK